MISAEETQSIGPDGNEGESDSQHRANDKGTESGTSSISFGVENGESDNEYDKGQESLDIADEECNNENDSDIGDDQENTEQTSSLFGTSVNPIEAKAMQTGNNTSARVPHSAHAGQFAPHPLG